MSCEFLLYSRLTQLYVQYVLRMFWYILYIYSFKYLFHDSLLQGIECSSLCYTVGPCCLSVLYIIVSCIYQPLCCPYGHMHTYLGVSFYCNGITPSKYFCNLLFHLLVCHKHPYESVDMNLPGLCSSISLWTHTCIYVQLCVCVCMLIVYRIT